MRKTVNIEAELVALLEQRAHALKLPFRQVLNDALRCGLAASAAAPANDPQADDGSGPGEQPVADYPTFALKFRPEFEGLTPKEILAILDDEYYQKKLGA